MGDRKISSALISVYNKENLEPVIRQLDALGVQLISTGGTQTFITSLGIDVTPVEELTKFPEVMSGRVKTLHPKIFGGILSRRDNANDIEEMKTHDISAID
ncbi:MAG: bifunctional phosphoribosylaminoimidazolecarboxamide formyltransferase/IMP cyclohydrolase PurH, partial [Salinivirgaceae bacterium]|nr:bifunctional phosphoribosylaminoimidazolecarboxamide formyltransferase/IMP cyclohydrolase PurH [Salinivirgaceae bacterium]